ncbi:MAG: RIP metalloprotease RseP [Acidobacteriia bacterium]|nr:RIP metalloprotease RseP [Terriglobia bacterium]
MQVLLGVVLVLGIMILVHEWGHFVMARLFGVRVDVFSIGFGPRIWGWKRGDTDYRISALPLGGYVRMAGQDLSEVDAGEQAPTGASDELMSKPRWQRALISFGGPLVNLVLPVILLGVFFIGVGVPYPAFLDRPVQVTALPPAAAGAAAGPFQVGDRVLSLDGTQNPTWEKALDLVAQAAPGSTLQIEVENSGARRSVSVPVKDAGQLQRLFGYPPVIPVVDEVLSGSPAYRAGMRPGDQVLAINGRPVETWAQFVDSVRHSDGQKLALRIARNGQEVRLDVTPYQGTSERGEPVWQVGIQPREEIAYRRVGFIGGSKYAVMTTAAGIDQLLGVVGKLFSGRVSVKQLQGVVGIARESGQAVRKGPSSVLQLMAFISLNLGVLNLLPIPILDGGHILLLAVEGLRRRDLSLAFKERFVQVGFVFLLLLFVIVMYNDVMRILPVR